VSVIMGLRLSVDPDRFMETVNNNKDALMQISSRGKEGGAIHHSFYASASGDAVLVVDEWPDPETFQRFFEEAGSDIGALLQEAGVSNQPQPEFWRQLDTPDKF
jgi:glutamate-1-semialdehyde aminotransferase